MVCDTTYKGSFRCQLLLPIHVAEMLQHYQVWELLFGANYKGRLFRCQLLLPIHVAEMLQHYQVWELLFGAKYKDRLFRCNLLLPIHVAEMLLDTNLVLPKMLF